MQDIIEETGNKEKAGKKQQNSGFQLQAFLTACLHNWYWFVLSIIACGSLAYLYSKAQTKLYSASAKIIITTKDSKTTGSQAAVFSDLGVAGSNNIISNEIYKLKSTSLMETGESVGTEHTLLRTRVFTRCEHLQNLARANHSPARCESTVLYDCGA